MGRDFYSETQAAEYASLSVDSIKRAVRSGDLPTVRGMRVNGHQIQRNIISHDELVGWMLGESPTRLISESRRR